MWALIFCTPLETKKPPRKMAKKTAKTNTDDKKKAKTKRKVKGILQRLKEFPLDVVSEVSQYSRCLVLI